MAETREYSRNMQAGSPLMMRPELWSLGMAFVPDQPWQNIYETDVGFARGTIFADLDFPFIGEEAICGGKQA